MSEQPVYESGSYRASASLSTRVARGEKMTEQELKAIVDREIRQSIDYIDGEIGNDRRLAIDLYYQEPFGNEQEGRSEYVSSDVQDTVEGMMPSLMEIFGSGDEVTSFSAVGPEDMEAAEQATDMCNHVYQNDNDGYTNTSDFIKTGLLQKQGVMKIWWDDTPITKRETIENLNSLQLQGMMEDDGIELVEHTEKPAPQELMEFFPDGVAHDVTIIRTAENGRCKLAAIPPEEFLISRRSVTLDEARFLCHKVQRTRSELLEMGFDPDIIAGLPTHDEQDYNEERQARFQDEEWLDGEDTLDPASQIIWTYECHMNIDWDGDGILERRQVTVAGSGYTLLENIEEDDHPFVDWTPIKMPHKFFGRSMADLTSDIQAIKSTLVRIGNDNAYLINNARSAISNAVDLDDWLVNRPGAAVRVDTEGPDVAGHITPIITQPLGDVVLPMLEYFDNVREVRTGVARYNQGLNQDALHSTATGANIIMNQAQKRMLLIARNVAEMGFKRIMKKILRLLINHQDRARTIRLRGKWVEIDPRSWNADMDVTVNVGLGHGTKESQAQSDMLILQLQQQIIQMQGGIQGPFVMPEDVFTVLKRVAKNNEYHPDTIFTDPKGQPPPQPQPDPKAQEAQAKLQLEQQKFQMDAEAKKQEMQMKQVEMQTELQQDREKASADIALEREKFLADIALQREKFQAEMALESQKVAGDLAVKQATAEHTAGLKEAEQESKRAAEALAAEKSNGEDKKPTVNIKVEAPEGTTATQAD
jgi:hypothetical protein